MPPAEIGLVEPILAIPGVREGECVDAPLPQIGMVERITHSEGASRRVQKAAGSPPWVPRLELQKMEEVGHGVAHR
jgi:hypothetical protein